jgi:hypothetical protein
MGSRVGVMYRQAPWFDEEVPTYFETIDWGKGKITPVGSHLDNASWAWDLQLH